MPELILPYRTDWREMHRILDYCKGKGADRATLEIRFGGGESLRETLNALEQLALIDRQESGDVLLTEAGDQLIYARDEVAQQEALVLAMLNYQPYRVPFERAVDDQLTVLDAPLVERIWQVEMRLGQPRNRVEEARTFFFRLADDAGLGTYRRGVRGQTTRLELDPDGLTLLERTLLRLDNLLPEETLPVDPDHEEPDSRDVPSWIEIGSAPRAGTALTVHVDMSEWDLKKIEAFLRMIGYLDTSSG